MTGTPALLGIGLLIAVFIYIGVRKDAHLKPWAEAVQALLTALAIVLAGYWYFVERKGEPHADVTQKVDVMPLEPGIVVVEATIQIKNIGTRLLKIKSEDVRLQKVAPAEQEVTALADLRGGAPFSAKLTSAMRAGNDEAYDEGEIAWPTLQSFDRPLDRQIEAGETDQLVVDFIVRCDARAVRIASYVSKDDDMSWSAATLVNLREPCAPPDTKPKPTKGNSK